MRPPVRGRAESLALKTASEGKDKGGQAAAELCGGGGGAGYADGRQVSPVFAGRMHRRQACVA